MIDQPLFEHLRAALPADVAPAAGQEAGDGVAAEVVDPALEAELAHQGVDPGEAGAAFFPAGEPFVGEGRVDGVVGGAGAGVGRGVDGGGEVPGDEAAVAVVVGLGEGVPEDGLRAEIHVAEEELADEVGGDGGLFAFWVFREDVLDAPVEEADGEGAEVVMGA